MNNDMDIKLELYSPPVMGRQRRIYHSLTGEEAYSGWHILMYFKEIVRTHELISRSVLQFDDIPRKEKNVLFFLMLRTFPQLKHVTELGSSLFELIDALELVNKYFISNGLKGLDDPVSSYRFNGIEKMALFNQIALHLHRDYNLTLVNDHTSCLQDRGFLYDRATSSYAFRTAGDLAGFLNKFDIALLNLFVSKNETFISTNAGGLFTYFSIRELTSLLDQPLFHLFGYKSPHKDDKSMGKPVIEGFFLYGSRQMAEKFIKESQKIPEAQAYFLEKEIHLKDVRTLL